MMLNPIKKKLLKIRLNELKNMPRFKSGNINIQGWNLDYLDGQALYSCIDVLVLKKWNDFVSDNDRPVILDCGSNIGISVLNYKRQYPHSEIVAFEPDPSVIKVLKGICRKMA